MSNKKFSGKLSAKGYYIALALCIVAIGVSGYLFYRNSQEEPVLQNNPSDVAENQDHLEVVATQPEVQETPDTQETQQPTQTAPKRGKVLSPVSGNTALDYSMDALCYNPTTRDWRTHNGMDIAAAEGTTVCAAANGTVESVSDHDTMGTTVVISHADGYKTTYSSLAQEVSVSVGQFVQAGDTIGTVGNTALLETALGEHLHFAVTCYDKPVDPKAFLEKSEL